MEHRRPGEMDDRGPGSGRKTGGSMNTTPVLEVRGLSKSYGELRAVHELSFSVAAGEVFGIMGPNGSGKTTTIECVLGTRAKDEGEVAVLGRDPVSDRRQVFRRVGVQFQDSAWQPGIRVDEICRATACLYDPEPEWRPLLESFDLAKRARTAVESLSGGERQKLSILLACLHGPELVFLDELTTGLDPVARRETWRFIRRLQDEGTTVVLTSHFMDEVEQLCARAMILRDGRKIVEGTVAEVKEFGRGVNLEESYINLVGGHV
ncbi:MAG: ABC transporter ATP-binding protein [Spirochaetaceae bacterium]|nr:MAG: ABC transporter ATP-binding protein [Spirochaetaceae bacterium]